MLEWFIDDLLHENQNNNVRKFARAPMENIYSAVVPLVGPKFVCRGNKCIFNLNGKENCRI